MKWLFAILTGLLMLTALALIWLYPVRQSVAVDDEVHNLIPSDVNARLVDGGDAVQLRWTALDVENVSFVVQRALAHAGGDWIDLAALEPGATSYIDRDIDAGKMYVYRLRTFDEKGGSGVTSVVEVVIQ